MMHLVALVVGLCVFSAANAAKCDKDIIDKISKKWGDHVPKHILKGLIEVGDQANVRVSDDICSDDIKCMYNYFEKDPKKDGGAIMHYTNVLKNGEAKTGTISITERSGHLENDWADGKGKALRFLVYRKNGIWAYYKCEEEGKEGKPQGYVKTGLKAKLKDSEIDEAVQKLKSFGIDASKKLSAICTIKGSKDWS